MPKPGPKQIEFTRRTWHSENQSALRLQMKLKMHKMLIKAHKPDTVVSQIWQSQMPKMVLRLEEALYSKAKSYTEYESMSTLEERLQSIMQGIISRNDFNHVPTATTGGSTTGRPVAESVNPTDGDRANSTGGGLSRPQLRPCIEATLLLCSQPKGGPGGSSSLHQRTGGSHGGRFPGHPSVHSNVGRPFPLREIRPKELHHDRSPMPPLVSASPQIATMSGGSHEVATICPSSTSSLQWLGKAKTMESNDSMPIMRDDAQPGPGKMGWASQSPPSQRL